MTLRHADFYMTLADTAVTPGERALLPLAAVRVSGPRKPGADGEAELRARFRRIKRAVADAWAVGVCDIESPRRGGALARQCGYWLAFKTTRAGIPRIAREFYRADHSTIIRGIDSFEAKREHDPRLMALSDALLGEMRR